MNKNELLEWLGFTPAGTAGYLAIGAAVGLYFVQDTLIDIILSGAAFILSIIACVMGAKPDERLSGLTNTVKLISYPALVPLVLLFIYLNFTR
jgi:hypothetical protein